VSLRPKEVREDLTGHYIESIPFGLESNLVRSTVYSINESARWCAKNNIAYQSWADRGFSNRGFPNTSTSLIKASRSMSESKLVSTTPTPQECWRLSTFPGLTYGAGPYPHPCESQPQARSACPGSHGRESVHACTRVYHPVLEEAGIGPPPGGVM